MEEAWQQHSKEIHACNDWFFGKPLANELDRWE